MSDIVYLEPIFQVYPGRVVTINNQYGKIYHPTNPNAIQNISDIIGIAEAGGFQGTKVPVRTRGYMIQPVVGVFPHREYVFNGYYNNPIDGDWVDDLWEFPEFEAGDRYLAMQGACVPYKNAIPYGVLWKIGYIDNKYRFLVDIELTV